LAKNGNFQVWPRLPITNAMVARAQDGKSLVPMYPPHQANHCITSQTNLVPSKGFVHIWQHPPNGTVLSQGNLYQGS
jgi:hypothetical protein